MPGYLNVVIGGPAVINHNFNVYQGVANGTTGLFAKVILKPHAKVYVKGLHGTDLMVHTVRASYVDYIVFKHMEQFQKVKIEETLRPGYFSIKSHTIQKKVQWTNTEFTAELTGFKAVSSYAFTGHKTQGRTMDEIIVGGYQGHKHNKSGWIYVVLSRVSTMDCFFTLETLDRDVRKYKPRLDVKRENDRLVELSANIYDRLLRAGFF